MACSSITCWRQASARHIKTFIFRAPQQKLQDTTAWSRTQTVSGISAQCLHYAQTLKAYRRAEAKIVAMNPTANDGRIGETALLSSGIIIA